MIDSADFPTHSGLWWMLQPGERPEPARVSLWTDHDGVGHFSADTLGCEVSTSDLDLHGTNTRWVPLALPSVDDPCLPPRELRPGPALGCSCGFPDRAISRSCEVHGDWNEKHPEARMPVKP